MAEDARIERECDVFCRYLTGTPPNDYVRRKYRHAHVVGSVEPPGLATRFDYFVVDLARNSPWMTQAMDSYSRILAPAGLLRRKLVLLLAILECDGEFQHRVDTVVPGTRLGFFVQMALFGARFALTVLVTSILLLPARLAWASARS